MREVRLVGKGRAGKTALLILVGSVILIVSLFSPGFSAPPPIKRPYDLIEANIEGSSPGTVDPAFCYDTASGELLMNVYDTLVSFDGERLDRYIPQLATDWAVENITGARDSETGLNWSYRYTFKIRTGVPFQNSTFGVLTPEDVEYCFERAMVMDMDGGPQWMFYEPLLNGVTAKFVNQRTYDPENNVTERVLVGKMIDHAVESNVTHVWFNLGFPGAYPPFMQILAQTWSSIYSKACVNSLGRASWNGTWGDYTDWWTFHNPSVPPLDDPTPAMMGTGPFALETLDQNAKFWSVKRFADYWRGWPANFPKLGSAKPAGYIEHFVETWAFAWESRSALFLSGDIDFCAVPRQYKETMFNETGVRCVSPLPSLAVDAFFFNFKINAVNPYGPIFPAGTFNETGIPSDFFGNPGWGVHVRKGFAYAIDYDTYIAQTYKGEATKPPTAILPILPYYDSTVKGYTFNLTRAAEEFKQVPGLWETGFTIQLPHNSGSLPLYYLQQQLKNAIENLNPKFHVTLVGIPWSDYLSARKNGQLTAYILGWLADYPDPHDFAVPFYCSHGDFSVFTNYSNPSMDALIDAGIKEADSNKRATIYRDIQALAIEDCPNVALDTAIGRHFERDWVAGWYYNPTYSGIYAYSLWKWYYVPHALLEDSTQPTSSYLPADVNYDGDVNIIDLATVAMAFGSAYGPPTDPRWNFRADTNNDRTVNIIDIAIAAKQFGKTSTVWTHPP